MAIQSATVQLVMAATANESASITDLTARTSNRDTFTFANGTGSLEASAIIDKSIVIASNSTTTALSALVDTLEGTFAGTELKAWRIAASASNVANVTVTSNVSGIPNDTLFPNTSSFKATAFANGYTIAGANALTFAGNNNDVVNVTLIVS
jgi:hypothetical protein